jgi:hypothetical protein
MAPRGVTNGDMAVDRAVVAELDSHAVTRKKLTAGAASRSN